MENFAEKAPERIPERTEVLEVISRFCENPAIVRELSDDLGLYLLEVKVLGENPGEIVQYEYRRQGVFPDHNESTETVIHKVYYENGMPVGGEKMAVLKDGGVWEDIK